MLNVCDINSSKSRVVLGLGAFGVLFTGLMVLTPDPSARPIHVPQDLGYIPKTSGKKLTHLEARDLCRKKFGRTSVGRAQIKSSGRVICWLIY